MKDILQAQIALHIARAAWWTAYANTPANLARKVYHGTLNGTPFTRDELVDDAMRTANTHLSNAQACLESLNTL